MPAPTSRFLLQPCFSPVAALAPARPHLDFHSTLVQAPTCSALCYLAPAPASCRTPASVPLPLCFSSACPLSLVQPSLHSEPCPSLRLSDGLLGCWPHCHSVHSSISRWLQALSRVRERARKREVRLCVGGALGLLPEPSLWAGGPQPGLEIALY